jgi:hypothetical protein
LKTFYCRKNLSKSAEVKKKKLLLCAGDVFRNSWNPKERKKFIRDVKKKKCYFVKCDFLNLFEKKNSLLLLEN